MRDLRWFIETYPEVDFDLIEHLKATPWAEAIGERFERFLSGRAQWPPERAAAAALVWKARGLAAVIPAYREYAAIGEVTAMPFLDKNALRARPDDFVSPAFDRQQMWFKSTSGTTGRPVPIWYAADFYFDLLLLSLPKIAHVAGIDEITRRAVSCVRVPDWRYRGEWVMPDPTGRMGLCAQIVVDDAHPGTLDRLFRMIGELEPACVSAKPCVFELILERLAGASQNPFAPVAALVSGGSCLEPALRACIEERFQRRVIDTYGMTEFGLIASECSRQSGLHVHDPSMFVEVVAGDGSPCADGELGELVLSSMSNAAMPLLRYRTGDLARVERGACQCGDPSPRVRDLSGRVVRAFRSRSGAVRWPTHFNRLFSEFAVREFQMTQVTLDLFELLVEPSGEPPQDEAVLLSRIEAFVAGEIEQGQEVRVRSTAFRRDGKFERYRSLL